MRRGCGRRRSEGGFAERGNFARLEKPQQLRLQLEAELADLVEEQRAVPGGTNHARVVAIGAGERAAAMAEQLALEHLPRDRRAVERHERLVGADRIAMDGAGQDLLAGAAFAGNEDVDVTAATLRASDITWPSWPSTTVCSLSCGLPPGATTSIVPRARRARARGPNRTEEESDRIHGGDRLDVGAKLDPDFHRPAARGADREDPFRQAGIRRARRPERRERFERSVRAARHRRRRHNRASILENGDEASRDELRTTCVKEQGRDVLEKILSASALSSHLHVLSRPVPCSRELQLTANVVQPLIGPS